MREQDIALNFTSKDGYSKTADKIIKKTQQIKNEAEKTNKLLGGLGENFKSATLATAVRKVANYMKTSSEASANYIESLNLLGVAFEGDTKAIREFTSTTAGKLNLDEATLINAVGHFRTLADSMNLSTEAGKDFSQLLTQLNLDLSSLYNVDFKRMQSALQAAVEGQGKSLKQLTGASVLESSVQTQLQALGVDAYVEDMNDSEKAVARLISITYQLQSAQGDLANTIEAPANQMRVFGEQTNMLARNIGNILLPVLSALLPILNGILIAINSILGSIAKLTGFDESDYDFVKDTANSFDNLGASVGGVGDSAKKAKKELSGLRGFDKLNVIRTPQESTGSGASGGGSAGVNPKLLKTLSELLGQYDSKLEGIRTKASDIAEKIIKWLGFTYELDPITGKLKLKYNGLSTTLKNMWNTFKKLPATAKILVAVGLGTATLKLYKTMKKLTGLGLFKSLKNLLFPTKTLLTSFIGINNVSSKLNTVLPKIKTSLLGIGASAGGTLLLYDNFKKASEQGWNLSNTIGTLTGSIGILTGAIQVGYTFGGTYGAIIGGIVGVIGAFATAVIAANNALTPHEQIMQRINGVVDEYNQTMKDLETTTDKQLVSNLAQTQYYTSLTNELDNLVDANGRVKEGYEDRVNFILNELKDAYGIEFNYTDGQIKDYDKLKQKIKETIQQKEAEYLLDKFLAIAEEARAQKATLQKNLTDAENDLTNAKLRSKNATEAQELAQKKFSETLKLQGKIPLEEFSNAIKNASTELENAKSAQKRANDELKESENAYKNAANAVETNNAKIQQYEDIKTAVLSGDYETLENAIKKYQDVYIDSSGKIIDASDNEFLKTTQNKKKQYDELKQKNEDLYNDTVNTLKNQTAAVENITDEQAAAWAALALTDTEKFMENFSTLPESIQTQVVNKMKQKGIDISSQLQNGLDQNQPTINVNSKFNSYGLKTGMESFFKRNSAVFGAAGLNIPPIRYAQGGLPPVGQMFIANERGPELVGQIGGQSFVANQNQMMDIIDKKLQNAGGGIKNATFIVQVGNTKVGQVVLNDLQQMAKDNGKPIKIGV